MQAVILAAGLGARMKELTRDTPKPLLKAGEKTLLEHKFHNLPAEISEVVIVVGYLGDKIKEALGAEFDGRKITYVEQTELKGTAHALSLCEAVLNDRFLVLMGDDLYAREDLQAMRGYPLAILAWELPADEPDKTMGELVTNGGGKLTDIVERPARKGMLMNTGAYMLDRSFFDYPLVPKSSGSPEMGLPQTIVPMAKDGKDIHIVKATWWQNVTSPEDLAGKIT